MSELYFCSSQQKVADMKQVSSIMKESVWVEDKSIAECKGCNKAFSVSRRKVSSQQKRGGRE